MKKRILSILLTFCMVLMLVPKAVFAANEDATELQNLLNVGGTVKLEKDYTIDTTLNVTNTVTLDLNGHTIRMTGSGSVIYVGSGGDLTVDLTVQDSNPTATHTDASLPAGGVITGGNASSGGGVCVVGGGFTLASGTIANCRASSGGGVDVVDGTFTMKDGTIENCSASYSGGGVHAVGGSFTMNGGTITNCSADDSGGGVCFAFGSFTLTGGTITNCSADDSGGGVYVDCGSMTLTGGTITNCSADDSGGGVYVYYGSFTMNGGTIANCSASNYGGGVRATGGSMTLTGGTIANCSASNYGGGVFNSGDFSMSDGAIIRGCSASSGGGVYVNGGSFTLNGGTIEACTSTNGDSDAVYILNNASLLANGGTIKGTALNSYGTIQNTSADGCTVFYDAVENYGTISGGIYYGGIQNLESTSAVTDTYYTVSFDLNGGSGTVPPTQYFVNVSTAQALQPATEPTKEGYDKFAGWYNGGTKYEFTETVTDYITLTAKYENPLTYHITYNLDGGTASNPATYTVESDAITLKEPKKTDYIFTGWSGTGLSSNTMDVTIPKGSTGDRTYTANWSDATEPVISGIEDGKTYCSAQTVTVSDNDAIDKVTVNGTEVTLDEHNQFDLSPAEGTQTIVVTDKSGNETSVTVTVNDGHTYGEWQSNGDGTHTRYCTITGCNGNEIKLDDTVTQKLPPEIIDGKGQSITAGEKKELTFKSNAAFSDFIRIELDGKTLDENNYTVKEGSTVVTLKADYVATLSAGEHTIGVVSTNGTATTTFTVSAKSVVDNYTKFPQTGDNSYMALWFALLFVSSAVVIGTTVYGKKKRVK